jgi:MFS family permease
VRSRRFAIGVLGAVTITVYGACYYAYGVLIEPIHVETGWSLGWLGLIFGMVLALNGLLGIVGGRLADRAGTRLPFVLAGTVGATAMFVSSYQHELAAFAVLYAGGCGVIGALGYYHVTQAAAARFRPEQPQRAIVRLTLFGAFASPIFLPLTARLVEVAGWRSTVRIEATVVSIVLLLAALPLRDERPGGSQPKEGLRKGVAIALRDRRFRVWVLASLLAGAASDVLLVYQVPAMTAAGLPLATAAAIAGVRGFAQLAGRAPLGLVLTRVGARRAVVVADLIAALGAIVLIGSGRIALALVYTLIAGASLGAISTLQGIYTHELVDRRHLGSLLGVQQAVFGVGGALGPAAAGVLIESSGGFGLALLATSVGFVGSALLVGRA